MGQILIVHGSDPRAAQRVFASGLRFLRSQGAGLPDATFAAGATALAHIPRRHAAAPPSLVRPGAGQASGAASPLWSLAAGCWLCGGRADAATTALLGGALAAGSSAWRQASAALDGFFAIAAGDAEGHEVHVATDRTGTLHVYRTSVDGCEVLSTSALALGALVGAKFDPVAVHEFLGTGSVFEDRSLFADVEKLPPGTVLRFRDGRLVEGRAWWEPWPLLWAGVEGAGGTVPALAEALTAVLDRLLGAYPGAVLDLTGGFDTRAILGAALTTGRPFRTVVTGQDGDGDVVAAERIARECALRHTHLRPGRDYGSGSLDDLRDALALTDGEFDVVQYANVAQVQSRMACEAGEGGLTVNGLGGELCRDFWWWNLLPSRDAPGRAFDARHVATSCFATDGWADSMLAGRPGEARIPGVPAAPGLADHFTAVVERATAKLRDYPGVALIDAAFLQLKMERWAGRQVSSTDRLWPCVSPFLLEEPLQVMLSLPPGQRQGVRVARLLIDHLSPALAALPMAGDSAVPPVRRWIGRSWRLRGRSAAAAGNGSARVRADPAVAALLRPESMLTCALYDPDALAAFVQAAQRPGFGESSAFGRVLTLELVARAVAGAE